MDYYQVRAIIEGRERRYDVADVAEALTLGATIRRYYPQEPMPTVVTVRRTRSATYAPTGAGR